MLVNEGEYGRGSESWEWGEGEVELEKQGEVEVVVEEVKEGWRVKGEVRGRKVGKCCRRRDEKVWSTTIFSQNFSEFIFFGSKPH